MSITDELKEWMFDHTADCSDNRIALVAIADRIDEELAERYVALPVDADGVPIRVGDEVADRLKAENASLRELVRDMWPHVRHRSSMCAKCELPCDTSDECLLYEPMRKRMAELGIEVE